MKYLLNCCIYSAAFCEQSLRRYAQNETCKQHLMIVIYQTI